MNETITKISARVIENSRGNEVVAVTVSTGVSDGTFAVPEGASTGSKEVRALPAEKAVAIIERRVAPALVGHRVSDQEGIDALLHHLDETPLFENIGGNSALGVSVAALKAAAASEGIETWEYIRSMAGLSPQAIAPRLFVNLINGGKHAPYGSAIQEHQIIPQTDDIARAYNCACQVHAELKKILEKEYGADQLTLGDEGGFCIPSQSVFDPFLYLAEAINASNCAVPVAISADIAASSFFKDGTYHIEGTQKNREEMLAFYKEIFTRIPTLMALEDPLDESDMEGFAAFRAAFPDILTIGDDLTTTNILQLEHAIKVNAIGGIIIKPNQIGTVSDTLATMRLAYQEGIKCVVSHRSGETMDDFIADLAYATGSFGFKAGAPHTKEREVKYQRLIKIGKSDE